MESQSVNISSASEANRLEIVLSVTVKTPHHKPETTEFRLTPAHNRLQIGRERRNEIWLDDESVSRFHASVLMKPDGRLLIADLDSRAGTIVNEKRLTVGETLELPENAVVKFGKSEAKFEWKKPEANFAVEIEKSIPPDIEAVESTLPASATAKEEPQLIESEPTPETKKEKPEKSVARSAGIVSIAVMGSRVIGLIREQVFAAVLGASDFYDAYLVAFRIPNLLRDLFAEGALSVAFVKTFTDYQIKRSEAEAWRLASLVFNALVVILSVISLLGILLAPYVVGVMAYGFAPEKAALTVTMTQIMFPFLLFVAMAAVAMGVLNTKGVFGVPASASTVFNIVSIIVGLSLGLFLSGGNPFHQTDPTALSRIVIALSIGTLIGGAAQFVMQVPSLFRVGFRFSPALNFADEGVRQVFRLMTPAILGTSAVQINVMVNTSFVSDISGAQGWLSCAFRLMQLPIGIFGVAVATAAVPALSKFAAQKDLDKLRETIGSSLRLVFLLTVPSACGLIVLGEPIIRLIYERGKFNALATGMTAWALAAYALGLTGYAAIKILSPAFYALDDARTPMIVSLCSILVNAVAGYTFRILLSGVGVSEQTPHGLGHVGVALATSSIALVNFFALVFLLKRKIKRIEGGKTLAAFAKIAVASALLSVACWFSYYFLHQLFAAASLTFKLIETFVPIALGGIVFVVAAKLLGVAELNQAYEAFARKFGGKKQTAK